MTADFLHLGTSIKDAEAAGVDFIHLDVMDGRFVPNITFGFAVVEAIRGITNLTVDVHLMIEQPERHVEQFVRSGADIVTVHVETCGHLHGTLRAITAAGAMASVTLNPGTSLHTLEEVLPMVEQVLVMSVNPGFGGQSFIPGSLDKIRRLRSRLDVVNPCCRIEVDGGIKESTIRQVVDAGADTIVAGSAVFGKDRTVAEAVRVLRAAMDGTASS